MNEPIQKGDRCEVIAGALGTTGPNIGNHVTVGMRMGEHSKFGVIWECHGADIVSEYGAKGGTGQFAQGWLRKIEPPPAPLRAARDEKAVLL